LRAIQIKKVFFQKNGILFSILTNPVKLRSPKVRKPEVKVVIKGSKISEDATEEKKKQKDS